MLALMLDSSNLKHGDIPGRQPVENYRATAAFKYSQIYMPTSPC